MNNYGVGKCEILERIQKNWRRPVVVSKRYPYRKDEPIVDCWVTCDGNRWHTFRVANEIFKEKGCSHGTSQKGSGNELNYEWAEECPAYHHGQQAAKSSERMKDEGDRVQRYSLETLSGLKDWQMKKVESMKNLPNNNYQHGAIIGAHDTHKTHISLGLDGYFISRGINSVYVEFEEIPKAIAGAERWSEQADAMPLLKKWGEATMLIVDSIGKHGKMPPGTMGKLETFIDRRIQSGKKTISVTRNSEHDLIEKLGQPLYDRFFPASGALVIDLNRR